jgi:hypothetical protein
VVRRSPIRGAKPPNGWDQKSSAGDQKFAIANGIFGKIRRITSLNAAAIVLDSQPRIACLSLSLHPSIKVYLGSAGISTGGMTKSVATDEESEK